MASWEKLANGTFSTHTIDSGTFTAKKYLRVIIYYVRPTTVTLLAFGSGASGTMDLEDANYGSRRTTNGGSWAGYAGGSNPFGNYGAYLGQGGLDSDGGAMSVIDIVNIDGKIKEFSGVFQGSDAGATNAPTRTEFAGKWTGTNQITRIQAYSGSDSDSWESGTKIIVFGADDLDNPPNLKNGATFLTSDTNELWMWDGSTTWNQVS
jgi:hypothetical protein